MHLLCSYSLGAVFFELHRHSNPFHPPVYAGQHGCTMFVKGLPFLWEGLDSIFDTCKASFLSSFSPFEEVRKQAIYWHIFLVTQADTM